MVRIVSGQQEYQDPGLAFLSGYQGGQEQRRRARQEQQEQAKLAFTIQKAMSDYQQEQAKALAEVNARAQMGDAIALQQQMLEAQAAGAPTEQKMIQEFVGSLGNIHDPKARAQAVPVFKALLADYQKQQKHEAVVQGIQRAGANGLIDPMQYEARLQAGEDPDSMLRELGELEEKKNISTMAMTKNAQALEQGQALVDSMPDGNEKLMAEYVLTAYQNDAHGQQQPGTGMKLMDDLRGIVAKVQDPLLTKQQVAGKAPAPGLPGMTVGQRNEELLKEPFMGFGGPDVPSFTGGTRATTKKAKKETPSAQPKQKAQVPQAVRGQIAKMLDEGVTPSSASLKAAGIPLTREVQELVRQMSAERGSRGAGAAGE